MNTAQPDLALPGHTLVVLRHGKSDYPLGVTDHARPLAARGRTEAARAGAWIQQHVPAIDQVLCSTAQRTRETLTATGITADVEYLDDLYGSSAFDYLAALREHGAAARTLLVVGHEPSVSETALLLARDRTSAPARRIREKYPTSAIAVLRIATPWAELDPGLADLVDFHVPR